MTYHLRLLCSLIVRDCLLFEGILCFWRFGSLLLVSKSREIKLHFDSRLFSGRVLLVLLILVVVVAVVGLHSVDVPEFESIGFRIVMVRWLWVFWHVAVLGGTFKKTSLQSLGLLYIHILK